MWVLKLNDMRAAQIEMLTAVCRAQTREELESLLEREMVQPYADEVGGRRWHKGYRKGGPLEWYNAPWSSLSTDHFVNVGTADDWAQNAREAYSIEVEALPVY